MTTEWTERDSWLLDRWAASSVRVPLQRDQRMWELLAEDRAEAPRKLNEGTRPFACIDCRMPMRSGHEADAGTGETVRHWSFGLCLTCAQIRKTNGIPLPKKIRAVQAAECRGCTKQMVPQHNPVPDGYVEHHAHGLCRFCYRNYKANRRIAYCKDCGIGLRPQGRNVYEYDIVTRPHGGGGYCTNCYERRLRRGERFPSFKAPANCLSCRKKMRPSKTTLDQHPGTVGHYSHGLCTGCHKRWKKARSVELSAGKVAS